MNRKKPDRGELYLTVYIVLVVLFVPVFLSNLNTKNAIRSVITHNVLKDIGDNIKKTGGKIKSNSGHLLEVEYKERDFLKRYDEIIDTLLSIDSPEKGDVIVYIYISKLLKLDGIERLKKQYKACRLIVLQRQVFYEDMALDSNYTRIQFILEAKL